MKKEEKLVKKFEEYEYEPGYASSARRPISFEQFREDVIEELKGIAEDEELSLDLDNPEIQIKIKEIADDMMGKVDNYVDELFNDFWDVYQSDIFDIFPEMG